ncbi:MAG: hypothetical protein IT177_19320 [Acidobacteria bacterium]|nr:hypothetical protein [Acidobacteriota bacterium]
MSRRTTRVLHGMAGFFLSLALGGQASADPVTSSTLGWAINGIVSEVARAGDVAFVGGSFGTVAPAPNLVHGFATFATDSAVPVLPSLDVNGRVRAVVALPGGGWLIGGEFTQVNGQARSRIARLLADGTVDSGFSVSMNGTVWAMAASGTRVFLGGSFTTVNGSPRLRMAALDAATGALDATFTPDVEGGSSPSVRSLVVAGGSAYFGGSFAMVNGASQANLGAVDATTGDSVAGFTGTADGRINALVASGTSVVAAGEFMNIGGEARRGVARLVAATGLADAAFDAGADGDVAAVALSGTTVFVGGSFGHMGGQPREHLAQLNLADGSATPWNPGADADVQSLALAGTALVVAGDFDEIGGAERLYLAALDATSSAGAALPWNPSLNDGADFAHVDAAGHVFTSGSFNFFGAVKRENLAAIDLLTGELLPWNPGANGWIRALDVLGNTVYIGGDFTTIGGESRAHIAALDVVTGAVSSWTAEPNARVNGLMVSGNAIYFVGEFSQVKNSTSRGRGAAVATDGTVLPWNPAANAAVESLFVEGDRVYLGGDFTTLGGVSHERLGAVDVTTGAEVTAFAPSVNGPVYRVDAQDGLVFFGGDFSLVNGSTRDNVAAVKAAPGMVDDGELQGWNPQVGGPVYDIDAFGDDVYLSGGFGSVGGESRPGIAMVDALASGGAVRAWEPEDVSGGAVSVIDTSETAVLFGGLLNDLDGISIGAVLYPEAGLVGAPPPPTTPEILVRGSRLTMTWNAPPLGARPSAYVIEGGSGPGGRNLANFSTGSTDTSFTANGLAAGTYFVRMRSANAFGVGAATLEQAVVVGAAGCSGPPAPPLDVRASVNGSSVTVTWREAPQSIATSYRLIAGTASGSSNVGTFDVGATTSFSTTAPPGAYFVRAQAVNPCGAGAPSAEAVAVVGSVAVPPGPVFALSGGASGSTVSLEWAAPSVGTGPFQYRVEAGSASGLSNLATLTVQAPAFVTAGVPPGIYYVRVRAITAAGVGPAGNEIIVVVQ